MRIIRSKASIIAGGFCLLVACSNAASSSDMPETAQSAITVNGVSSSLTYTSDWGAGFCANVTLTNANSVSVTNWTAVLNVGTASITSSWGGAFTRSGSTLTVVALDYNRSIPAKATATFGLCANGTARPTVTSLAITTSGTSGTGGATSTGGATATGGVKSTGGTKATGGTTSVGTTLPDIKDGTRAWATRYWDCCKPACGWTGNATRPVSSCTQTNQVINDYNARSACDSGSAYMCWSAAPHERSSTVSYGYAAAAGGNYTCGQCYQIQFDGGSRNGSTVGAQAIKGKQMIVQIISNGGVANDQFDLLIPGGGVGAFNACTTQWGTNDLGAQYGGFLAGCNGDLNCVKNKCSSVFSNKPDLLAGCNWFVNWFKGADNPTLVYKAVPCPSDFNAVMGGLQR